MDPPSAQPPQPTLCHAGCGFFGNPSFDNMCSKCFKDTQGPAPVAMTPNQTPAPTPTPAVAAPTTSPARVSEPEAAVVATPVPASSPHSVSASPETASPVPTHAVQPAPVAGPSAATATAASPAKSAAQGETPDEGDRPRKIQKNTGRCFSCNKKIGLTGFHCRCGYFFCGTHRYSDQHNCDFDYKTMGKAELHKANPTVVASKFQKI